MDGIVFDAIIGILPQERIQPQPVALGFSIWLDIETAARSGALDASVDYSRLTEDLRHRVQQRKYELLETLVLDLAQFVLDCHDKVQSVEIRCGKPTAIPGTLGPVASLRLDRLQS